MNDTNLLPTPVPGSPEHRAECRERLSRAFGVPIQKIGEGTGFPDASAEERLGFEGVAKLTQQRFVRNAIAELTGKLIPLYAPSEWHSVAQQLLDAAEDEPCHPRLVFNQDADLDAFFAPKGGWVR